MKTVPALTPALPPQELRAIGCESLAQYMRNSVASVDVQRHSLKGQFIWVTKGGGRARIDGTVRGFGPSTAIFVPHLTMCGFEFTQGSQGWIVSVDPSCVEDLPQQPMLSSVTALSDQSQLSYLFDAIEREIRAGTTLSDKAVRCQLGLLSVWFVRHESSMVRRMLPEDSARRRLMRRFIELLDQRYAEQNTVANYASELSVTTTHLTRVCRQTTGKPALTIIQDRVIQAARQRLETTDSQVSAIARELGFDNAAYFSRLFTQKTGHSPSQHRKLSQL
jgi:AraC family transcriptional activator of pobA